MTPELAQAICHFPDRLHPVSQLFFDRFVQGYMTTADFMRFFSLPNSDYIELGHCFVQVMTG
jgi:hypothetical protein